jgi:ATP-dependent Clp protease ATP-binding subunit ClpC
MQMTLRPGVTSRASTAFAIAHDLADQLRHDDISATHVAVGLLREEMNIAAQLLVHGRGLPRVTLEAALLPESATLGLAGSHAVKRAWTPSADRLLDDAAREATALGSEATGCEHVLLAILHDESGAAAQALGSHGVHYEDFQSDLASIARGVLPTRRPPAT